MSTEQALQRIEPEVPATTVEAMIVLAIERGATVETLERLMAIRREVRAEQAKQAFDNALARFQAECPTIQKTAKVMNKDGKSVRYQYAPLDAIIHQVKGLLQQNGFSYSVNAKAEPTQVTAICKLTHAMGHSESSEFAVPIDKDAYMNPAQQVASALTFAKRYAFCNACGIMTGDQDDDSQGTVGEPKRPQDASKARTAATGAKTPATGKPGAKQAAPAKEATEEQKAKFLRLLAPLGQAALDYARDKGWILPPADNFPGEPLEVMSLIHVPTTQKQFQSIMDEIRKRMDNVPYGEKTQTKPENQQLTSPPKGNGDREPVGPCEAPPGTPGIGQPAPALPPEPEHHQSEWWNYKMPWGKKAGTPLGQLEKSYLFGLWINYEVETEYRGKPRKAYQIAADEKFRAMLDCAGEHYGFTEP